MTRKHFKRIAALLKSQRAQFKSDKRHAEFCRQMGYVLSEFNDNFQMSTFLEACLPDDTKPPVTAKDLI